jgi:enoyl-CoA hydratase/carnithine racemase
MSSTRLSQIQGHLSSNSPLVLTSSSANSQVITLTINHATRANCLSTPVLTALLAALSSINPQMPIGPFIDTEDPIVYADRAVSSHSSVVPKVIIIKSMGQVFCSGHDLREFHISNGNPDQIQTVFNLCNELMLTIHRIPQIVISQVSIFFTDEIEF